MHAEVTEMLLKFDINRDGDISFDEFLRMIVMPPWCRLLPGVYLSQPHSLSASLSLILILIL